MTLLPLLFLALVLAVIGLSAYRIAPHGVIQYARIGFGAALAAAAVWALFARQVAIAVGLASIAVALLRPLLDAWRGTPSPGRRSQVRTGALAAHLDHDTGEMDAEVLAGRFAGRTLSELAPEELQELLDEWEGDKETVALILAFLDRRGGGTGEAAAGGAAPAPDPGRMSEAEAFRVLGLEPGASAEEIRAAHRRLMKKVHPDLGGSPALAALINAARQRLDPH